MTHKPYNPPTHEQYMTRVLRVSAFVGSIFLFFCGSVWFLASIFEQSEPADIGWLSTTSNYLDRFVFGPLMILSAIALWNYGRCLKKQKSAA